MNTADTGNGRVIEYAELTDHLPHRFPFILVDRVLGYKTSQWIEGVKNVSSSESFLKPRGGKLEYPAALATESVGQLVAILFSLGPAADKNREFILGSIGRIEIFDQAFAGDQLRIHAEIVNEMSNSVIANGYVDSPRGRMLSIDRMITVLR